MSEEQAKQEVEKAPVEEKKVVEETKPVENKSSKKFKAHISKHKSRVVKKIVKLMKDYPIVGAVNMENMPAGALAKMRGQLREQCTILMTKRRVMKFAFEEVASEKKGILDLVPHLKGMPALLFTKENPFSLYKFIKEKKTSAPAKGGQEAPEDIVVKAGPTPFAPGPVISELGAIGLKTQVVDGKIHITEDNVVAKAGEEISGDLAGMLLRLGIEPMEIGLDLVAVYEDGVIYDRKVLNIDEEAFAADLSNAARWAFNLAVEAGHFTKETVNVLIPKAFNEAKAVALEGNVMNDETKEEILAKAESQANSLKDEAKIEVGAAPAPKDDDKKEEEKPAEAPKEEVKVEEKPVEEKKEEAPKVEEKKEEVKETPAEEVAKEEAEVKEEIKEIKEEVKELKENPDPEKIKELKEEVKEVEEKLEDVEEKKAELPPTAKVIVEEEKKERVIDPEKQKAAQEGEALFDQLKKEGTLRNVEEKEVEKPSEPKSPQEIIADAHKKMADKDKVPSAHDLMKNK